MKKLITLITLITIAGLFTSCTNAERSKLMGYGGNFKVEMYSGGQKVREWISSGKVLSEDGSNGYYFTELTTGKLIEVDGDIVITKQ
jgi:hypothetical protein